MSDSNEEDRIVPRRDPRNNADDAYAVFMGMSESEWEGLNKSGGMLQPEEHKGFIRALKERHTPSRMRQMDVAVPDYSGEAPAAQESSLSIMKRLNALVVQMATLELRKLDLERETEENARELRQYQENLVPELMAEIGLSTLRTTAGIEVEMKEDVRASFPKEESRQAIAFAWLKETGNDGMIKREITVKYGRDSVTWADQLVQKLEEWGVAQHGVVEQDWTIHHQTLVAFLKSELREGRQVPLESFGAFVQRRAIIKKSK